MKMQQTRTPACQDRVASTLAMFHEDMSEGDNNELSTNDTLRTDGNTTTITTDTLGSTRVNTTIEIPGNPETTA